MSTPQLLPLEFHDALLPLAARATCTSQLLWAHGWRSATVRIHVPSTLPDLYRVQDAISVEMEHWSAWASPHTLPLRWWLPGDLLALHGGAAASWTRWMETSGRGEQVRGVFFQGEPSRPSVATEVVRALGLEALIRLDPRVPLSPQQRAWRRHLPAGTALWCGVAPTRWSQMERQRQERVLLTLSPRRHVRKALEVSTETGWPVEWASAQPDGPLDPLAPLLLRGGPAGE